MTRFTVLLIASMLVAGLHGAAPAWAGHSSDCGGGVACSWVDPPAGASGGNVTPYTPPPPDPFAFRLQRFQAVTAQVRNVIGDRVGTPANDQDMSTQLGALYDIMFEFAATARLRAAQANARVEAISPVLKALEMESDRAYLNYHEQILPQTKQAEARAAALTEQVARAKVMRDQISTTQRYFEGWARAQKTSIGRWFNVVLPASREVAELRPPFIPMPLRGIAQPPPLVDPPMQAAPPARLISDAPQAMKTFTKAAKPALPGPLEERLAAAERLAADLTTATASADQSAAALTAKLARYAQYAGILNDTQTKTGAGFAARVAAEHTAHAAEHELAGLNAEALQLSRYLMADAAEQYAWSQLSHRVVVPELKRMVSAAYAGKPPYELTDEFVDQSWGSQKLHLFSALDKAETAGNAMTLVNRVRALVDGGEQAMIDAAGLLAMGSPAEAQAYAQKLSQQLDADARGVARKALETADIPLPYRAFWMKYFVSP
jgi:hypothetical protein